jgi:hypothetical protein
MDKSFVRLNALWIPSITYGDKKSGEKTLADAQNATEEYAERVETDIFGANSILATLMRKGKT